MALNSDELLKKSIIHRKQQEYELGLIAAMAASEQDPNEPDTWWQVALNSYLLSDYKKAVSALEKTIALSPHFGSAWLFLGKSLYELQEIDSAKNAFVKALELNENAALKNLAMIYRQQDIQEQDIDEIAILENLKSDGEITLEQQNRLGILYYRSEHYFEAIKHWKEIAFNGKSLYVMFNLGLAFNNEQISQDSDAIDMWRLVLDIDPDYASAKQCLERTLPRMRSLAEKIRGQSVQNCLPYDEWYSVYLNPFILLGYDDNTKYEDLENKLIQKKKKLLLQEIELEEGNVPWVDGLVIDISRALSVLDSLNNDKLKIYHWMIFKDKNLNNFLSFGVLEHFLVGEYSPIDTLKFMSNEEHGFKEFLGQYFSSVFDRMLTLAIDGKDILAVECMLDGRRWVPEHFDDLCFVNSRAAINRAIISLRKLSDKSKSSKVSISEVLDTLENSSIISILSLLPAYFEDYQNEVVTLIKNISINSWNTHSDIDLANSIIQIAKKLKFKSIKIKKQLDDVISAFDDIIEEQHRYECIDLMVAGKSLSITSAYITYGREMISTKEISGIRWGIQIAGAGNNPVHNYHFGIQSRNNKSISISWKSTKADENRSKVFFPGENKSIFQSIIDASVAYIVPDLVSYLINEIKNELKIENLVLRSNGIQYIEKGWIFSSIKTVSWKDVDCEIENGHAKVFSSCSGKILASFPIMEYNNAVILGLIMKKMRENEI